jgi:AcrR family transcriptional regulator
MAMVYNARQTEKVRKCALMTRQPSGRIRAADDGDLSIRTGRNNGQITRPLILQTALRIIDRDGVGGLSLRRLSDAVGRDPTVLYRRVPNKAAVLDGVIETVLAQLAVDIADPDWAAQLRSVAHDFHRLALAHPNLLPLMVTRPLDTPLGQRPPGMLRPLEDILTMLTCAGFAGVDALHIYRLLFGFLYGHIIDELQEVVERPEGTDDVLRLGLKPAADHRVPPSAGAGASPRLQRRRRRTRPRPRCPVSRPRREPAPPDGSPRST